MSPLILPRRLAQQPTRDVIIDPNSPFARGFLAGYVPTNYNRYFGNIEPSAKLSGNPRFVYDSKYGLGIRRNDVFSSGLNHANILRDRLYGDVTILGINRPTTSLASNTNCWLVTMSHIGNGATLGVKTSDGTNKVYLGYISINGGKNLGGSFPVPADRPIVVSVLRHKKDVEQALFINGVKDPNTTSYTGNTIGFTVFGNYTAAPDTETYMLLAWDRALSDEEIVSISANPYQLFLDRSLVAYSGSSQAGVQHPGIGLVNGVWQQLPSNSGYKPLVLIDGQIKERVGSEGDPVILVDGQLRTLGVGETLRF